MRSLIYLPDLTAYPNIFERLLDEQEFAQGILEWELGNLAPMESAYALSEVFEWKAMRPDQFDIESRVLSLHRVMRNRIDKVVRREVRKSASQLVSMNLAKGDSGDDLTRVFGSREAADKHIASIIETVQDRMTLIVVGRYKKIDEDIRAMKKNGESRTNILAEIRKGIGLRSAWRKQMSISLVTQAIEDAKDKTFDTAGRKIKKTWHSLTDGRTRTAHLIANGQTRWAKNRFFVGGVWMRFPGDPTAPLHLTINCRCWMTYERADNG